MSVVGPTATSAGSSATSSTGGVGATNGLNPGSPNTDINLTVPNTGNVFDIPSLDVSIDYRRNESVATMFKRTTFSSNNGAANFRMTYRVVTGTVVTTVTSSNVAIPQDNTFRNYRFTYDNCSGTGQMYVDNVSVWTSPTLTPNQNLYWSGDGSMVIGQDMDGAGNNVPNLDNFIYQNLTCAAVLPVELLSFSGYSNGQKNILKWATATESNNNYFTIEHSSDGENWTEVKKVYGAGTTSSRRDYSTFINEPEKIVNYYRLKQTDFDGQNKKFKSIFVDNSASGEAKVLKTLDLLGREVNDTYTGVKLIYFSDGSVVKTIAE
ncbi:hypothetical protein CNR22_07845 [Sphingobacteriaceae bacterium]|nr:hypothetical protein CNR22_07845 [Sphingobacteriaceae bacterium]